MNNMDKYTSYIAKLKNRHHPDSEYYKEGRYMQELVSNIQEEDDGGLPLFISAHAFHRAYIRIEELMALHKSVYDNIAHSNNSIFLPSNMVSFLYDYILHAKLSNNYQKTARGDGGYKFKYWNYINDWSDDDYKIELVVFIEDNTLKTVFFNIIDTGGNDE